MEKIHCTVELAKLYEDQGYNTLAMEQYSSLLAGDENNKELSDAVKRVEFKIEQKKKEDGEKKVAQVFEKWLKLLMLEKKLRMYKHIQKDHLPSRDLFPIK